MRPLRQTILRAAVFSVEPCPRAPGTPKKPAHVLALVLAAGFCASAPRVLTRPECRGNADDADGRRANLYT